MSYSFKNLAGVSSCDETIKEELKIGGLLPKTALAHKSEVPYTIGSEIRGFVFTRAWRYWVVSGQMPKSLAIELNNDTYNEENIRIGGCGYSSKDIEKQLTYYGINGKEEMLRSKYNEYLEEYSDPESMIRKTVLDLPKTYNIVDTYSGEGVIATYHIDSLLGLKRFVDFVKEKVEQK